jgi:hypothetical protein
MAAPFLVLDIETVPNPELPIVKSGVGPMVHAGLQEVRDYCWCDVAQTAGVRRMRRACQLHRP